MVSRQKETVFNAIGCGRAVSGCVKRALGGLCMPVWTFVILGSCHMMFGKNGDIYSLAF